MRILIIGGTGFLGRHLTEVALARSHKVTLFNRGQKNPGLFPSVEQLHGNRDGELAVLANRQWDIAIDTCGYFPRVVGASARALSESVGRYIFISSISAYADFSTHGINEDSPVARIEDETVEEITGGTYGALKALCEEAAENALPGRVLVIRPGLIVGPHDHTDRFTYWPVRVARGGEMLAPGEPEQQTQFIDVCDLAAWTIQMAEAYKTGLYNATGPNYPLSFAQFLEQCKATTGSDVRFTWVSNDFLVEREVDLPLWVPDEYAGMRSVDCSRAIQDGLTFRPIGETVKDTLAWKAGNGELRAGLKPEQEKQLLEEWHNHIL